MERSKELAPARPKHVGRAAVHERGRDVDRARRPRASGARRRPRSRAMPRARAPVAPPAEPISSSSLHGDDVAAQLLPAGRALELAQLLERVDPDVRVGADRERDPALEEAGERREAVAEVGLGRGAEADAGAVLGEQVELARVGVRGVHDRRPRAEAARLGEELDRPQAVLGEALLDLARLLVGVDVEHEALALGVAADLLEPVARARADGVGGEPDAGARLPQRLDLAQVVRGRGLPEALDARRARRRRGGGRARRPPRARPRRPPPPPRARRSGTRRRPCTRPRASRRTSPRRPRPDMSRGQAPGQVQHGLAPGPEVPALDLSAQRALEGVAVRVDEPWEPERSLHRGDVTIRSEHGDTRGPRTAGTAAERAHGPAPRRHPGVRRPAPAERTARGATGSPRSSPRPRSPTRSTGTSRAGGTSSRSSASSPTRSPTG